MAGRCSYGASPPASWTAAATVSDTDLLALICRAAAIIPGLPPQISVKWLGGPGRQDAASAVYHEHLGPPARRHLGQAGSLGSGNPKAKPLRGFDDY
jgi:hypothetical protein